MGRDTVRVKFKATVEATLLMERSELRTLAEAGTLSPDSYIAEGSAGEFLGSVISNGGKTIGGLGYEHGRTEVRMYPEDGSSY